MKKTLLIVAGHGGVDENGYYTTGLSKMYDHSMSKEDFHDNGRFFEGIFNRIMSHKIGNLCFKLGIPHLFIHHPIEDLPLNVLSTLCNLHDNAIVLNIHANASSNHIARGYEIYTHEGESMSDAIAESIWNCTQKAMKGTGLKFRHDLSDGDHDKEAKFWMLEKVKHPSVLIEYGFFDNLEEAKFLHDDKNQHLFAQATISGLLKFL